MALPSQGIDRMATSCASSPVTRGWPVPFVYLLTRWWIHVLDPETGIATCTGDQVH